LPRLGGVFAFLILATKPLCRQLGLVFKICAGRKITRLRRGANNGCCLRIPDGSLAQIVEPAVHFFVAPGHHRRVSALSLSQRSLAHGSIEVCNLLPPLLPNRMLAFTRRPRA
jgi:hypothetical protein